jgi:hypothetical protein
MATDILSMQDYRDAHQPHLVLSCADAVHVVPVAYIEALVAGEPVEPLSQPMLAAILKDWLALLRAESEAQGGD